MNPVSHVPGEWQRWISENLTRGASPEVVIQKMVEHKFDLATAQAAVAAQQTAEHPSGQSSEQPSGQTSGQTSGQSSASAADESYVYETPRIQSSGRVISTSDRDVHVVVRSERPVIVVFDDMLSADECDEMLLLAQSRGVLRSTVVDPQSGAGTVDNVRTSFGTYFQRGENELIARVEQRLAEVMNVPLEHGEGLQVLHYKGGGEYRPHFDFFPPSSPGNQRHLANGGQRVSTMILYLNDVPAGGETIFPQISLSVVPKKGAAVYFEYCNSQGQVDPLTLHGGAPVTQGEKWIATKWVRQHTWGG
ncbi:prolyl 4-hydroxylase [Tumebacillus sp. BK434]|uniref:2OG-Fe(II) oxygenase n=1 Tax=Tumebacillus sp. BK434 TaxID=2512169 RepID=UPI00105098D3|nr:2OG-Fe(II) oxygenase [Tumebacillus sp. BK434]TCP56033.1 prolyl 4-hydroxylase [Tumebacillus sp. BK434]